MGTSVGASAWSRLFPLPSGACRVLQLTVEFCLRTATTLDLLRNGFPSRYLPPCGAGTLTRHAISGPERDRSGQIRLREGGYSGLHVTLADLYTVKSGWSQTMTLPWLGSQIDAVLGRWKYTIRHACGSARRACGRAPFEGLCPSPRLAQLLDPLREVLCRRLPRSRSIRLGWRSSGAAPVLTRIRIPLCAWRQTVSGSAWRRISPQKAPSMPCTSPSRSGRRTGVSNRESQLRPGSLCGSAGGSGERSRRSAASGARIGSG